MSRLSSRAVGYSIELSRCCCVPKPMEHLLHLFDCRWVKFWTTIKVESTPFRVAPRRNNVSVEAAKMSFKVRVSGVHVSGLLTKLYFFWCFAIACDANPRRRTSETENEDACAHLFLLSLRCVVCVLWKQTLVF